MHRAGISPISQRRCRDAHARPRHWRKVRDSNPRRLSPRPVSNRVHSASLPTSHMLGTAAKPSPPIRFAACVRQHVPRFSTLMQALALLCDTSHVCLVFTLIHTSTPSHTPSGWVFYCTCDTVYGHLAPYFHDAELGTITLITHSNGSGGPSGIRTQTLPVMSRKR